MLCEECGQRPATVHFTEIVQGKKSEYHLCETCAREKGATAYQMVTGSFGPFSVNQLLSGLMSLDSNVAARTSPPTVQCDECGLTYQQFAQLGKFGCPHCYEAFSQGLGQLLRRVQSSDTHVGKVPRRAGGAIAARRELTELRQHLQQRVTEERFEEAAKLRDRIRKLEDGIAGDQTQGRKDDGTP